MRPSGAAELADDLASELIAAVQSTGCALTPDILEAIDRIAVQSVAYAGTQTGPDTMGTLLAELIPWLADEMVRTVHKFGGAGSGGSGSSDPGAHEAC